MKPAEKRPPEQSGALATQTRADDAVEVADIDPLHNVVVQSLRLAALPWAPWLRPHVVSAAKHEVDRPRTK